MQFQEAVRVPFFLLPPISCIIQKIRRVPVGSDSDLTAACSRFHYAWSGWCTRTKRESSWKESARTSSVSNATQARDSLRYFKMRSSRSIHHTWIFRWLGTWVRGENHGTYWKGNAYAKRPQCHHYNGISVLRSDITHQWIGSISVVDCSRFACLLVSSHDSLCSLLWRLSSSRCS